MKYLVGSRALYINKPNSDYDIHECKYSPENTHQIKFMQTNFGERVDVHEFFFENKTELMKIISPSCVQALLYEPFRKFWKITDEEAIEKLEQFKDSLRSYELLYYKRKLLKESITHQQIKDAYDEYKLSHTREGN